MIDGYCAWSVYSCMFKGDGIGTYMGDATYGRKTDKAISIDEASKQLGLQIEIFSEEPGMCFSEHYYIDNGEIVCKEETQYTECWLEYYDKESDCFEEEAYNELSEDFRIKVDKAIANGEDVLKNCDFLDEETDDYLWEYL